MNFLLEDKEVLEMSLQYVEYDKYHCLLHMEVVKRTLKS